MIRITHRLQPWYGCGVFTVMDSNIDSSPTKPIRSGLLTILLFLVIVGLLAAVAVPNFVGGGPSKISGITGILINIDRTKEEWAIEHGCTNNLVPSREITAPDIAPYLSFGDGRDPFVRLGLVIDKSGNLHNPQGVVFVINPSGISPEARFTKAFKLSDQSGFFGPKIPKGTVMRFSTNTEDVEYVLPGQESKPFKSLSELVDR
jgi:hypothetical protein